MGQSRSLQEEVFEGYDMLAWWMHIICTRWNIVRFSGPFQNVEKGSTHLGKEKFKKALLEVPCGYQERSNHGR